MSFWEKTKRRFFFSLHFLEAILFLSKWIILFHGMWAIVCFAGISKADGESEGLSSEKVQAPFCCCRESCDVFDFLWFKPAFLIRISIIFLFGKRGTDTLIISLTSHRHAIPSLQISKLYWREWCTKKIKCEIPYFAYVSVMKKKQTSTFQLGFSIDGKKEKKPGVE